MTIELSDVDVISDFDKCICSGVLEMKTQLDTTEEWRGNWRMNKQNVAYL